jgi:hypothetical protein
MTVEKIVIETLYPNRKMLEAFFLGGSVLLLVSGLANLVGDHVDRGYALFIVGTIGIWIGATALQCL